jgi:hypothetical protein
VHPTFFYQFISCACWQRSRIRKNLLPTYSASDFMIFLNFLKIERILNGINRRSIAISVQLNEKIPNIEISEHHFRHLVSSFVIMEIFDSKFTMQR